MLCEAFKKSYLDVTNIDKGSQKMQDTETLPSFKIEENQQTVSPQRRDELLQNPGFGHIFTDHMAVIHWAIDRGWYDARICPRKPFEIDPASAVLHYAQAIFEGLKAYRAEDGRILLFRPDANAERFAQSAQRLAMPVLPKNLFLEAVEQLVKIDQVWIPHAEDSSLYIRPFMFATERFLGVRASKEYIFSVIACPVGTYFEEGIKPVKVWLDTKYSRAGPGGTGAAKCGGNYASSLLSQADAYAHGCEQVLFLDVVEKKWIEELGGMNICFITSDNRLITPKLDGTILPGVTRLCVMKLARDMGLHVEENSYSFEDLKADAKSGKLKEVFACGTAAVIAPISAFKYQGGETIIGDGSFGPITKKLRDHLVGLQTGKIEDTEGWVKTVIV